MVQDKKSRQRSDVGLCYTHVAQCTSAMSFGFPILQGNAEALDRWGGKTKHHLISYFLSNTSAKNYCNQIVCVKIIASQSWDVFWDTVLILAILPFLNDCQKWGSHLKESDFCSYTIIDSLVVEWSRYLTLCWMLFNKMQRNGATYEHGCIRATWYVYREVWTDTSSVVSVIYNWPGH